MHGSVSSVSTFIQAFSLQVIFAAACLNLSQMSVLFHLQKKKKQKTIISNDRCCRTSSSTVFVHQTLFGLSTIIPVHEGLGKNIKCT